MQDDPAGFDPQKLWQSQPKEHAPMTLDAIHEKALGFQRRIRRRNVGEYIAGAAVLLGFLPAVLHRGSWMMQVGGALIMAATIFVVWQLHRRASAKSVPDADEALADFYRRELIRQRDAVRSVAVWYLAPFVPGMTLLQLGRWFQSHATGRSIAVDHLIILLVGVIAVCVFLVIWRLNQHTADRLQRRIDEL